MCLIAIFMVVVHYFLIIITIFLAKENRCANMIIVDVVIKKNYAYSVQCMIQCNRCANMILVDVMVMHFNQAYNYAYSV